MASAERSGARLPRPTAWELGELAIQAALLPFVLLPRPAGLLACRLIAAVLMRGGSRYRRQLEAQLPPPLAVALAPGGDPLRQSEAFMLYERVMVLRGALFPCWRRRTATRGLEHVRSGLAAGRGVILWVQPCLASSVAVKQALWAAGLPLAHLTRPAHGFSPFPFGRRFVNPFLRRAEDRFLAERVVIAGEQTIGPLRRLRALLGENRVVSITVTEAASRLSEIPFLGGWLTYPAGPVELARATGAVLLPVFTVSSSGPAVVVVGPALPLGEAGARSVRPAQEAAAAWLGERVAQRPLDWVGWRAHLYRRGEPGAAVPKGDSP